MRKLQHVALRIKLGRRVRPPKNKHIKISDKNAAVVFSYLGKDRFILK